MIRDIRVSLLSEKNSDSTLPSLLEVSYLLLDKESGMSANKNDVGDVNDIDMTMTLADFWNECINKIRE